MKQLVNVFPHGVVVNMSLWYEKMKWLADAGCKPDIDFEVNHVDVSIVEIAFKKPRLAMEFKLAWG